MARKLLIPFVFSVLSLLAQQTPSGLPPPPAPPPDGQRDSGGSSVQQSPLPDEGNIPEEDENERKEEEYHFNPLRAKKEFDTGMFYYKKGSYRAAAARFIEATRWNPGWAEAYLKLGEAQLKLKHKDDARKSLGKVVQLEPNSKEAKEAKKLTAKL